MPEPNPTAAPPVDELMRRAYRRGMLIPAFNVPFLPMVEPIVRACVEADALALVAVARLEWVKFGAVGPEAVQEAYARCASRRHTRLHLDHVPVIDEDGRSVDYLADVERALAAGFDSVMVDASRLDLEGNIRATGEVAERAHARGVPVEAELGAVMGHEPGPPPDYEELFASGKGFTDPSQARRFVAESGCDWLSVAVGSIHGSIAVARQAEEKPATRLNIEHLSRVAEATGVPLVLHGGSGIPMDYIRRAVACGIAKMNIAAAIRRPYLMARDRSPNDAAEAVYRKVLSILRDDLGLAGSAGRLLAEAPDDATG